MVTIKVNIGNEYNSIVFKKINNILITTLDYGKHHYASKKNMKFFFWQSFLLNYIRIVWRGKAYRVRFFKKNSKFTLNFGHSHWYKLLFRNSYFLFTKIKRQNYLVFFSERVDKIFLENEISKIRVYSKYTRRGIRVKKKPYIKRFGKISQVNSILHSF